MESQEIETYLQALNAELARRAINKPVRLVVVGGVYMMSMMHNRTYTQDVDVIPLGFPDTMNANKETKAFRSAVHAVAKTYGMKRDWMNDVVASFIPSEDVGPVTVWREYEHLHILFPEPAYILALKLLAGRKKDEEDIQVLSEQLHIETIEQAQVLVDRYATRKWQQECMLGETLDNLFG